MFLVEFKIMFIFVVLIAFLLTFIESNFYLYNILNVDWKPTACVKIDKEFKENFT